MTTARFGHWTVVIVGLLLFSGKLQEPVRATPSHDLHFEVSTPNPGNGLTRRPGGILHPPSDEPSDGVALKGSTSLSAQVQKPAPKPEPPKINVNCVLTNHPWDIIDAQTKQTYEKDDWRVHCTVTYKKQVMYDDELPLARPTEFRDAMIAVDEFRTKRASQLVKEWEDAAKHK